MIFRLTILGLVLLQAQIALAIDREERLSAAYTAIGAAVLDTTPKEDLEILPDTLSMPSISESRKTGEFKPYYQTPHYENYFLKEKPKPIVEHLKKYGQEYIKRLLKKVVSPYCKRLKICKIKCYLSVIGDLTDAMIVAAPELLPAKLAVQTFMIESGANYLPTLCPCK